MARPTRTMLLAGAAAVVAAAAIGGGATYLATGQSSAQSSAQSSQNGSAAQAAPMPGHGKAGRGAHRGAAGGAGVLGRIEHGEFTTASSGVMQVQRGAITAIDAGSVTVRSTDGFTASYTITPTTAVGRAGRGRRAGNGASQPAPRVPGAPDQGGPGSGAPGAGPADLSALKTGDTVQVMATKTDSGSNATRIVPTRA